MGIRGNILIGLPGGFPSGVLLFDMNIVKYSDFSTTLSPGNKRTTWQMYNETSSLSTHDLQDAESFIYSQPMYALNKQVQIFYSLFHSFYHAGWKYVVLVYIGILQ